MLASQSSDVRILTEYRSPKLSEYISENMSYAARYVSIFCQDACDVVGVHTKSRGYPLKSEKQPRYMGELYQEWSSKQ